MKKAAFVLVIAAFWVFWQPVSTSAATRVFYDGFENDMSQWYPGYSLGSIVQTAADGGSPHNGSKMLECNWNGAVSWNDPQTYSSANLASFDYTNEFLIRLWVRYESDVDHKMGAKLLRLGPYNPDMLILGGQMEQTGGPLWIHWETINGSSGPLYFGSAPFGNGVWHKLEIYVKHDTGTPNGTLRVWTDGNLVQEAVNIITHSPGSKWMPLNLMSNWSNNPGWEHDANNHICWDKVEIFSDGVNGTLATGSLADASVTSGSPTFRPGDTDGDGKIDGVDLATLSQNWDPLGTTGPHTWAQGDFNGDGKIDGIDLATLSQNWDPLGTVILSTVTIATTTPNASESGSANGVFTVTRTGSTANLLAVNYTVGGTATGGYDYTPTLSGTVTIPAGSVSATVTITPVDDSLVEGNETVILTLAANPAGYNVGTPNSDTVTIADNDSSGSGTTTVLVDFGSSAAGNIYGLTGWNTPIFGFYTSYSSAGPGGIVGEYSGSYCSMGVTGTSRTFSAGEKIVVTWYNNGSSPVTFTPKVSLNDPHDMAHASGTWYDMSPLTLAAHTSGTATYTIDTSTAGDHSLVNVCRVYSGGSLLCDKIELQLLASGSSQAKTMTLSAPANASSKKPAPRGPKVAPSARKLTPWPTTTPPAARPAPAGSGR